MNIIEPYHLIETIFSREGVYRDLEKWGRTAYKSEDSITYESAQKFLRNIIRRGHESVLEHVSITVRFICDRGVTHEIVRHRLVAYTQESTRYCDYQKKGVTFIEPPFWQHGTMQYQRWYIAMENAERAYVQLMENGATPQEARSVLPNSLKTEIVATANIREWRHILRLRTASNAHPQMRQLMIPLLEDLRAILPVLFEDVPLPSDLKNSQKSR